MEAALTPAQYRAIWNSKPVLRTVYRDYYRRISTLVSPGLPTVEIGAGSGNLKDAMPSVLATDIVPFGPLDLVLDAQALPFADASVANLVGVDVLHHLEYPRRFLVEARRVLRPGGRVVLVEPAITPVSRVVFRLGHPEPVDMKADPLVDGSPDASKQPMDSNQAIPTLLVGRHRTRLDGEIPGLRLLHHEYLSLVAYPLSGGFRPWSLMPAGLVDRVLALEERLTPLLGRVAGFRLLIVLERPVARAATACE